MYSGLQSTCNPAVWKICALCAGPLLPLIPTFGTHHSRGTRGAPYVSYPRMACSASASQSELHRPPCTQSTGVHATKPCPECCTGRTAMFTCSQHPQFHALNKHDYVKKKNQTNYNKRAGYIVTAFSPWILPPGIDFHHASSPIINVYTAAV